MSDRDSQNAPVDAADLRLVEALYGESPADDVDDAELASLSDLRAMFRDLPEHEPPSAITAKLMSAAAEAVKARTPAKRGWWARLVALFEPIAAHPALAAAASLMLVVAVGGVLALTGRSDVAEPKVADEKVAVEGVAADSPAPATGDEQERAVPGSEATKNADGSPIVGAALPPSTTPTPTPTPSRATEIEDQTRRRRAREEARREKLDRARADVRNSGGKGKTGLDFSGSALDDDVEDTVESSEPDVDFKPKDKAPTEAPAMQKQQAPRTEAEVEGLTAKGRKAAAKGDCTAVRKYGARVQELDSDHYRDVYRRDAKINACYEQRKNAPNTFK